MADHDVLQALAVLKRQGLLEDSTFFASVRSREGDRIKSFEIFLPDISCINVGHRDDSLTGITAGGTHLAFSFNTEQDRDDFLAKWRLARLAAMTY